jgi:hypothetical protein
MNGGGRKKKTTPKKATKKHGGSFLGDLGQLAIPLGLIAAKEGVEYMRKKPASAKKASTAKKSGARRASFGGNPEGTLSLDSPAPYPSAVNDGLAATPSDSAIANTPTISTGASPAHLGGAARSAAIAREFRKMASEISEFLQKKKAASKPKKAASKPKKGGADASCEAKKKGKGKKGVSC